jgi:hypothetical protein
LVAVLPHESTAVTFIGNVEQALSEPGMLPTRRAASVPGKTLKALLITGAKDAASTVIEAAEVAWHVDTFSWRVPFMNWEEVGESTPGEMEITAGSL